MQTSPGRAGSMSPQELGELIGAFNEVTTRLQGSHEALRAEVARLTSELSEANAQIARSQRLAALGEMAAGIAHEVRNPLGSIRLYARMLAQDLADRPSERALADRIDAAVRSVDAIVGDVLSFSREFRVRPEPITPADLWERTLDACHHDGVPGWRHVRVVHEGDPDVPIVGDAALLQQALVNVVRNAYEAMADTPRESHELRLGVRAAADPEHAAAAVLWVQDTGPGVSPDVVARMFNPFFTTRHTGTGLGLAIVHRIIDAHGGRVSVRSAAPGPGACVEILLPQNTRLQGPLPARAPIHSPQVQETAA